MNSHFSAWCIVATLTCICMLTIADLLTAAIVQTQIQSALAINDTEVAWIGKSFLYCAALAPLYALWLASNYGYKRTFFWGTFLLMTGSGMTPLANHYTLLLICRSLAGTGGGIVMAITLGYIAEVTPLAIRDRAMIIYTNLFFGMGITFGLLAGGYFGQIYHWHYPFLFHLAIAPPFLITIAWLFPETATITRTTRYDFVTFLSLSIFCFALLLIITQAKAPWNSEGWHSPFIHKCLLTAAIALLILIINGITVEAPLLCRELFTHPRFVMGCLGMLIVGWMIFGVTLEMMVILETIYLYQRWTIGWLISSVGIIYIAFGTIPTLLIKYIHPRIFIIVGMMLIIASCFLHQTITIQSDMEQVATTLIVRSIGIALVLGPLLLLSLYNIPNRLMSKATAFTSFIRLIAATFGNSLIALVVAIRQPYHRLRFGEQVNMQAPRYRQHLDTSSSHLLDSSSSNTIIGKRQSEQLLIENIDEQATIAALNDAIYILGWMTIALFIVILALMIFRLWRLKQLHEEPELGF